MSTESGGKRQSSAVAMGVIVGAIVVFTAFALTLVLVWGGSGERAEAAHERQQREEREQALASLQIPEFTLTAQDGREVTRADLMGKWTVLSFGFTHCTLLCPIMDGQLYRVQGMIDDLKNVQFLKVSVDPEHDTVDRLKEYAEQINADTKLWTFARTDEATVEKLTHGLGLGLQTDDSTQIDMGDGKTMSNIVHSSRFMVVSPEGKVVGMYRGTDPDEVDRLVGDLRGWAKGG